MTPENRSAPGQGGATTAERPIQEPRESISCDVLKAWEITRVVESAVIGHEERGISEDELVTVLEWAERLRVGAVLLEVVLDGRAVICGVNGSDVLVRAA